MFSNTTLGWTKTSDGSVLDETGKILYFSVERFVDDICSGDCCFLCGTSPRSTQFNNEHILPKWVLKRYNLYSRQITLPNLTEYDYRQYVIPCCQGCNALLGREIEEPIQKLINEGYDDAVARYVSKNGRWLFFRWHCLIFLKTHLKDKSLPQHRDRRKGNETIGEMYDWEALHHIHCVARSIYTGATLTPAILGSFLLVPAQGQEDIAFDYSNLYLAASSLIRVDDMCFIAILNDAGAVLPRFRNQLQKIEGPLSPLQIREVFAHLSYINLILKERPRFSSEFYVPQEYQLIATQPDSVTKMDPKKEEFGQILYYLTREILEVIENEDKDQIQEYVRQGDYTFLFDSGGRFIKTKLDGSQ